MQTHTEVRPDAGGALWLWEITVSDVEGEGGARRVCQLDMAGATRHELAVREQIAEVESTLATLRSKLADVLSWKSQIEAAQGAA